MALPHSMIPGDIARSADVNDNFAYIMSILGAVSTPGRARTTTEFLMGPRQNILFTGSPDTGSADASGDVREYFQIGYNVDYNLVSGSWKLSRLVNGNGASAIRLGDGEVTILATDEDNQGLSSALRTMVHIKDQDAGSFIYIPEDVHFSRLDKTPNDVGDYRLTYVPLLSPQTIYGGANINKGTAVKNATNYGAVKDAKMIAISCEVVGDNSGEAAQIRFLKNEATPQKRMGFTVSAGEARYGSGFGFVPLGVDEYNHEFYIERTQDFDQVFAYVVGYFV